MRIAAAPRHPRDGYFQARPGDVAGRRDLFVVDVRDERELTDPLGHIHGVAHVRQHELVEEGLPSLAPEEPVVVVCNDGRRSASCARALLKRHGFHEVYVLVGGMRRWNAEERPVARVPTWTQGK